MRWGRPAYSSAPVWSRWSSSCTRTAACRWPKVTDLLQTRFGLHVTPGGLANLLHRADCDARPAYEASREQVRNAPVVTTDETGWRVGLAGHAGEAQLAEGLVEFDEIHDESPVLRSMRSR